MLNDYYTAWSIKTTEKYSLSIKITGYEGAWSCSENRIAFKEGMNIYRSGSSACKGQSATFPHYKSPEEIIVEYGNLLSAKFS